MLLDESESFRTCFNRIHGIAVEDKNLAKTVENDRLIVHGEYAGLWILHFRTPKAFCLSTVIQLQANGEGGLSLFLQFLLLHSLENEPEQNVSQNENDDGKNKRSHDEFSFEVAGQRVTFDWARRAVALG